ncbi:MAG: hypothetical protein COV59_05685 [Candidatus Magasanikbacteria bacterium CG11_big_fil_rev_8_21_14_0_20_39_34]|uniref:Gcp-like domain-containing protein n=1 Tax=Candidatus Magasanikbacteria bacterium CG11_big_fil_rev_8_21_14_0_20_39_34 TaxID=1974653 RepID=A0A2H0N421_9BACT|nr:MAG: hypothetical protein COV59_05685 [Candidatus Magasanikbacteria bacterium CG11_big_fil_rev_8_21_14_0_20_39_34]
MIDPSLQGSIRLLLLGKDTRMEKDFPAENRELLLCVDEFLHENKCPVENLLGVFVVLGSGGFTSTRIAVVVANTMSYVQKIPVGPLDSKQWDCSYDQISACLLPLGQYVSAIYSGEPNITKGKS